MFKIESWKDIKANCIKNDIKLIDICRFLGYTSIWGVKVGLKSKKKEKILEKAREFFYLYNCVYANMR